MMNNFKKHWQIGVIGVLVGLLVMLLSPIGFTVTLPKGEQTIGQGFKTLIIGTKAMAAGVADYTTDGTDDNVQLQQALNALPMTGGKLVILSGNYSLSATVTRSDIGSVTIQGMGKATYFTYNGVNPVFTAGSDNWSFQDLRTDAGGLSMGATTGWFWSNVSIETTYYAARTPVATTTGASWEIPTGRTASYVVAASNAPAHVKAQADYVCDGTNDEVEIQNALTADAGGKILLYGTFSKGNIAGIAIPSDTVLDLQGKLRLIDNVGDSPVIFASSGTTNITITGNGILDGNKSGQTTTAGIVAMGISFINVSNSQIDSISIIDMGTAVAQSGYGLYLNGSSFNRIHDVYLSGSKRENLCLYNNSNYNVVSGVIANNTPNRNFVIHNASYNLIDACQSYGGSTGGINIQADVGTTNYDNTIHGTGVFNSLGYGIYIGGANRVKLDGNTVNITGGIGINFAATTTTNSSIINNTVVKTAAEGVSVLGVDNAISNNTIISSTGISIYLASGATRAMVSGNTIINGSNLAISTEAHNGTIYGNNCNSNQGGIDVKAGADYNTLLGNTLTNNGGMGGGRDNGITVGGDYNVFLGNIFSKGANQIYGIRVHIAATGNRLLGNQAVDGGTTANIRDDGTTTYVNYNSGYTTESSGASVGTAAQQTIVHGLAFTPAKAQIGIFADNSTGTAYQSANPDATNIYVTEITGSAWHWATIGR